MSALLGPDGSSMERYLAVKTRSGKSAPPPMGNKFGHWAGREFTLADMASLAGGPLMGMIQFDLEKLTLADFRAMREHYQVNSSLSVLAFMMHQSDWHIEGGKNQKVRDLVERNIRGAWTQLNRGMSQAHWAGFSPMALEWDNDLEGREVVLSKVKDLIPDECCVNWKEVKGWAPPNYIAPTYKEYNGIRQFGLQWPIPVESSFWYPTLMENGNYDGRKLLKSAFQPWFFSLLIHMYANRYYERHGEPLPIGRAPFDEEIQIGDRSVTGNQYMLEVIQGLRSRSAVVLPDDPNWGSDGKFAGYQYDIDLLETQQRGADFERYLTRLDEEISLALFTPLLLLRTADVGSYNLGVGHMQMFMHMLNALNDDRAEYINKYLVRRIVDFNFGPLTEAPKLVFRKNVNSNGELIRALIEALVAKDRIKIDVEELGEMAGMTLTEVKETIQPPAPPTDPSAPTADPKKADPKKDTKRQVPDRATTASLVAGMTERVRMQARRGYNRENFIPSVGYGRQVEEAYGSEVGSEIFETIAHASACFIGAGLTEEEYVSAMTRVIQSALECE